MQASHVFTPGGPGCHTKLHSRWAYKLIIVITQQQEAYADYQQ